MWKLLCDRLVMLRTVGAGDLSGPPIFSLPVMFMAASLALDTTNAFSMKTRLHNAIDSATLATVTRLSKEKDLSVADAKAFAAKFLRGQIAEDLPAFADMSVSPTITITPVDDNGRTIWRVAIAMSGTQTLTISRMLTRVLTFPTAGIAASSRPDRWSGPETRTPAGENGTR